MNPLTWPAAALPLGDTISIILPVHEHFTRDELELLFTAALPGFLELARAGDPSIRSIDAHVVAEAVMRNFRGQVVATIPLAVRFDLHYPCEILPREVARRQAVVVAALHRGATA